MLTPSLPEVAGWSRDRMFERPWRCHWLVFYAQGHSPNRALIEVFDLGPMLWAVSVYAFRAGCGPRSDDTT
jgi:hypothetical protein